MKRKGLRFHYSELPSTECIVNNTKVTGQLLNLSTCDCAIGAVSVSPSVDEDILVKMAFSWQDGSLHEFTIKARVVRTNEKEFAAEFLNFEDDQKDRLLNCLLREAERELSRFHQNSHRNSRFTNIMKERGKDNFLNIVGVTLDIFHVLIR